MHIYLQWDPWVIRDPPATPTKKISRIQNPLTWWQLAKPGILTEDLEYQSPSLNYKLKSTDNPRSTSQRGPKSLLFFGKQNRIPMFSQNHFAVETISMLSHSQILPNMQHTPGHIPVEPPGSTFVLYLPLSLLHTFIRCIRFRQPSPLRWKRRQMPGPPWCGQM